MTDRFRLAAHAYRTYGVVYWIGGFYLIWHGVGVRGGRIVESGGPELADKLDLSTDQRTSVERLFDSMKAEALPLGAKLIEQEAHLDNQFANRTVTPESLKASTAAVAATQGKLRETHLKYHLSTVAILTPGQFQRYAELRGYGEKPMHHHH